MRTQIDTFKSYGFDLLEVDEKTGKFLIKKDRVCVYYLGNGSYDLFKYAYQGVCYTHIVMNSTHPEQILTKVKELHEL